jgi:hypothetical protein
MIPAEFGRDIKRGSASSFSETLTTNTADFD